MTTEADRGDTARIVAPDAAWETSQRALPPGSSERPVLFVPAAGAGLTPGRFVAWVLAGSAAFVMLAVTVVVLLIMVNLLSAVGALNAATGSLSGALGQAGAGISGIAENIRGLTDPARPPQGPIAYDAEFSALGTYDAGSVIGRSEAYTFTLVDVRRREESGTPEQTYYAVIMRELTEPREIRALGIVVGVDRGEQEHYLYKGQSYRLGRTFYKVNWLSWEQRQVGIATHRNPDAVSGPVAFAYD